MLLWQDKYFVAKKKRDKCQRVYKIYVWHINNVCVQYNVGFLIKRIWYSSQYKSISLEVKIFLVKLAKLSSIVWQDKLMLVPKSPLFCLHIEW